MSLARAVAAIDRRGALVLYPVQNRPDPPSVWSALYPRARMRWAWDDGADPRVVELWHLRERLATSRRVVYSKWLGGRAIFFSRGVFRAMLASFRDGADPRAGLSRDARDVLELLEEESPQATRRLRESAGLQGRALEGAWNRAMRELWSRLLVVGFGEEAEGGFPSLRVGATSLLFEDLWDEAGAFGAEDRALLARTLDGSPALARAYRRIDKSLRAPEPSPRGPSRAALGTAFDDEDPALAPSASPSPSPGRPRPRQPLRTT